MKKTKQNWSTSSSIYLSPGRRVRYSMARLASKRQAPVRRFPIANEAVITRMLVPRDDVGSDAVAGGGILRCHRRRGTIHQQTIRNPTDSLTSGVKAKRSSLDCHFCRLIRPASGQVSDDINATAVKQMTRPDSLGGGGRHFDFASKSFVQMGEIHSQQKRWNEMRFQIACFWRC